jgi:hypothetical protein
MSYCTNMCTLVSWTLPFSAQICVLWPLQPYLSVHKYVYFGQFNPTFQCTNMCTLVSWTLPFSAQICVLWPLQPYLSVHKCVYFGHKRLKKTAAETSEMVKSAYGEECLSRRSESDWHEGLAEGREPLQDDDPTFRLRSSFRSVRQNSEFWVLGC